MDICFTKNGWEEFEYWIENDTDTAIKIKELIKSVKQNPFTGIGKPEPLRHDLKGFWSRRISSEHRLVYKVSGNKGVDQKCIILQCRFHYDD
ncbi:Txe/YoeB family addiction module toxin [Flavobacterium branchiarum]|uniref:Putative mRNA interferase YoeB n=1 Tax=Flavobacterium branchiarum TaxID=1114870 RepID=A0ABV5FQK4_9FLAO|nr:Txe/YoeB family addiction module toxin [Flavobacterium branchiarum]MDN3672984.1 Txe/YoeB family addiction module toxin [Flavobacterium branchiarum]